MNSMTAALLGAAAIILLAIRGARSWQRVLLVLACAVQPLLFYGAYLTIVPSQAEDKAVQRVDERVFRRLGSIGIVTHGVAFDASAARPLTIGSAPSDLIQVPESVANFLSIVPGAAPAPSVVEMGDKVSLAFVDKWNPAQLPNTYAVADGMQICITGSGDQRCAASTPRWQFKGMQLQVSNDGGTTFIDACKLPHNKLLAKVQDATKRIFPLENYGRKTCEGRTVAELRSGDGAVPFSFFHYDDGGHPYFTIAVNDTAKRALEVRQADGQLWPLPDIGTAPASGAGDGAYRLKIYRASIAGARDEPRRKWLLDDSVEVGQSSMVLKREFDVRLAFTGANGKEGRQRLEILPTEAYVETIPSDLACVRKLSVAISGAHDRLGAAQVAVHVPFIKSMQDFSAAGATIRLARVPSSAGASACTMFSTAAITAVGNHGTVEAIPSGKMAAFGSATGDAIFVSVFERSLPILSIGAILLGATLGRAALRSADGDVVHPVQLTVLAIVDVLLVLRLVAAMQEAVLSPSHLPYVANAIVMALIVPLILQSWCLRRQPAQAVWHVLSLNTLIPLAAMLWLYRLGVFRSEDVLFSTVLLLSVFAFAGARLWLRPVLAMCGHFLGRVQVRAGSGLRLPALLLLPALCHLLLVAFGVRERLFGNLLVTTLWIPAYTVVFGGVFLYLLEHSRQPLAASALQSLAASGKYVLALLLGFLLPLTAFVFANDSGASVYLCGPALVLLALVLRPGDRIAATQRSMRETVLGVLAGFALAMLSLVAMLAAIQGRIGESLLVADGRMNLWIVFGLLGLFMGWIVNSVLRHGVSRLRYIAVLPGFMVIVVLSISMLGALGRDATPCKNVDTSGLAECLRLNSLKTNQLRLSRTLFPQRLESNFSREALGMSAVFDEMRWMVSDDWAGIDGKGFMTIPPRHGLNKHDGVPAIHIVSPFGRAFAALLICGFGLVSLVVFRAVAAAGLTLSSLTALCAASIFFFVSAFMILANLELTPFTGRNMYLVAALSRSDVLESVLLLLLILTPFRGVIPPPASDTPEGTSTHE